QLFLRLVSVDEQADDTRRRVRQSELEALDVDQPALRTVMRQFGSYRLLTFDRDPVTRSPTIEVAHEALIREWPRLRGWIAEQREELVLHRRFAAALQEWENAERADGFLLAGGRLEQFETWAGDARLLLTHQERAFLDRSRAWDRRRRRQRAVLLWSAIAVLASLAAVAFAQSRVARREAVEATARRLVGESVLALDADPELAILLALEGVEISQRAASAALPEAIGALHQAVQASRLELRLDDGWGDVEISPDGSLLVTDSLDPESLLPGSDVVVRDAFTGARLRTLSAEALVTQEARPTDGGGRALAFSPDGELLAVAYQQPPGAERTPIILWDPGSGQEIRRLAAPGQATWSPAWSPDGDLLAAASSDGAADAVTVWDASTGEEIASFQSPFVGQIGFHEGMLVVTHGPAGRVGFYDPATGEEVDALETPGLTPVYLDIDRAGDRVVLAGRHESLQVWHLPSRTLRWSRPISSSRRVQVDPAGRLVALTGDEGIVRLLDLDDGSESLTLAGHTASVWDVAYHPDGERLVSVATDGESRVWDITAGGSPAIGAIEIASGRPFILDFSPDGDEIGASTWDGSFERRAAPDGELLGSVEGLVTEAGVSPAVSPDWRRLASVAVGGEATVAQLASGEPVQVLPPCTNPRAFSPDGSALVLDGLWLCALTDPPAGQPSEADLRSRVIALPSGDELLDLGERVAFRAAFNPGGALEPGRYLAVNLDTAVLEVYDMASGSLVVSLEIFPTMIRFDPTGRYLASGTLEGQAIVLDLAAIADGVAPDDAIVMQRTVGPAGIPGIALTAEGVLATSAFDSPFIRLWNVHSGELLAELRTALDGSSPPQLNFSPDGTYLLYPDAGNVLRKFPLDVDRLAELARSRVTRTLTVDECRRHLEAASC
ncbi:MAG TPA: PQQ-binding-like beta-propeller repeat protein, partial [Egibacteraceae bacterium]|nr:PQQ-binding-like beta-propeller repeat protein [Egibacteraceae bacterium]